MWHRKIDLHHPLPMSTCFILMRMHSSLKIQVPQHTCAMTIHITPLTIKLILQGQFTWLIMVFLRQLVLVI